MDTSYNLYLDVFSRAAGYPERIAFKTIGNSLTYGQLQKRVLQAAVAFRHNGINSRSCLALDARTALPSLTAALACALIGCKWVFASREAQGNSLLFITHLVQDGPHNLANRYQTITMDEAWRNDYSAESKFTHEALAGQVEPERILVIGQSSGTTGEAKFFPITAEVARKRSDPKYLVDLSPLPVVASMFHVLHSSIFFGLLRVFTKGGTLVFGVDKAHWLKAGVTLLLASPMHASQIFDGRAGHARGKIPRIWVTGSPIYPAFLNQALDHFDEVVNSYGSIEASVVCHQVIKDRMVEGEVVGVGSTIDDVVLQVVDEIGQLVKPQDVGEVRYRSPLLTTGYIGDSVVTKTFFRNEWFYPGDTGYLDAKNHLFITGRVNDLLNIGGTKLNAATVDGIALSLAGISDVACFTEPSRAGFAQLSMTVVTPYPGDQNLLAGKLVRHLSKHFAPDLLPRAIYFADSIPRNDNGKVLRNLVRQKAEAGDWHKVTVTKE